jgi:hypothetical protein
MLRLILLRLNFPKCKNITKKVKKKRVENLVPTLLR